MWIPKTEEDIRQAIQDNIQETGTLDAKSALPTPGNNKSIAEDVAAMSTDGGVLLYGVAEDANKHLTGLTPIVLKGVVERITNIVNTSVQPVPYIHLTKIPTDNDPTKGYVVVQVPMSPQAPHMVIVDKDHRYYGRNGPLNIRLGEGDVARLYARRQQWTRSVEDLTAQLVEQAPLKLRADFAYLHLGSWPIGTSDELLEQATSAAGTANPQSMLDQLVRQANEPTVFRDLGLTPPFSPSASWRPAPDGWFIYLGVAPIRDDSPDPRHILKLAISNDGSARIFCGNAAQYDGKALVLLEDVIAATTTRFLWLMGQLYHLAGYVGQVDLGLAIPGIKGVVPSAAQRHEMLRPYYEPYEGAQYHKTRPQVSAQQLHDEPQQIARALVMPLIRAVTFDRYDPFTGQPPAT